MERTLTRSSTVSLTVSPHREHSASSQTSSSLWFALTRNRPWVSKSVEGQLRQRRRMVGRAEGRTSHWEAARTAKVFSGTGKGRSTTRSHSDIGAARIGAAPDRSAVADAGERRGGRGAVTRPGDAGEGGGRRGA